MVSPQLSLSLSLRNDATFENFYTGDNVAVVAALKNALAQKDEQIIYFWGHEGVGCSHLLQACCHAMNEKSSAVYLDFNEYQIFPPEILEGFDQIDLVCMDHVHLILGKLDWEEALFHFYNRAREQNRCLLVSGGAPVSQLVCQLEDVRSRLSWGLVFQVKPLSDLQKIQALMMRAKNCGMDLSEFAAQYLLNHAPRSLSQLFSFLETLDKVSLVEKRRITIPFIKSVLQV